MIAQTIIKQIGDALKAKDEVRLSTLRMLASALNYAKIALQHDLSDDEEIVVVRKEAKKRKDAIEAYEKAGALDRADKEKQELAILKDYMPPEISETELKELVKKVIADMGVTDVSDMGRVIGKVIQATKGAADGKTVSDLVRAKLTS